MEKEVKRAPTTDYRLPTTDYYIRSGIIENDQTAKCALITDH